VIGILGDPVSHSLSPRLHNAAFAALGLDYVYVPLPVRAAEVGAAVRGLAALGLRGANVTIPHKGAVLPFLDELSEEARLCAAVNTIVVDDDGLRGYNTDVEGVRAALAAAAGAAPEGERRVHEDLGGGGGAGRGGVGESDDVGFARQAERLPVDAGDGGGADEAQRHGAEIGRPAAAGRGAGRPAGERLGEAPDRAGVKRRAARARFDGQRHASPPSTCRRPGRRRGRAGCW